MITVSFLLGTIVDGDYPDVYLRYDAATSIPWTQITLEELLRRSKPISKFIGEEYLFRLTLTMDVTDDGNSGKVQSQGRRA